MQENTVAPVKAEIRLFLPFRTENTVKFRKKLYNNPLWLTEDTESCFYLKYIDRIFNKSGIFSDCLIMKKEINQSCSISPELSIILSSARIFSFDTATAFAELKFTAECNSLSEAADISAFLRLSNRELLSPDGTLVSPNRIAEELISPFGKVELFDHLAPSGEQRAELFVSVVADESTTFEEADSLSFNIASGLSGSFRGKADESRLYHAYPDIRWAVTDKGVCVTGIKTREEKSRFFVENKFPGYADKRYIVWFIIALHLKYALYRYMNEIAETASAGILNKSRKKIMELNTKYRFSIISDETSYQRLYEMMCESRKLDSEFNDIDGEVERISEFYETEGQNNTTRAMTFLSIVCGFSLAVDTCELVMGAEADISFALKIFLPVLAATLLLIIPTRKIKNLLKKTGQKLRNFSKK